MDRSSGKRRRLQLTSKKMSGVRLKHDSMVMDAEGSTEGSTHCRAINEVISVPDSDSGSDDVPHEASVQRVDEISRATLALRLKLRQLNSEHHEEITPYPLPLEEQNSRSEKHSRLQQSEDEHFEKLPSACMRCLLRNVVSDRIKRLKRDIISNMMTEDAFETNEEALPQTGISHPVPHQSSKEKFTKLHKAAASLSSCQSDSSDKLRGQPKNNLPTAANTSTEKAKLTEGTSERTEKESISTSACPICQASFQSGMSMMAVDAHIAACLSSADDDVVW